ncbi:MAG: LuxR family transcriptional regulator [Comamonadaceae bacterium]|nr:MAG: LuxR family transcriptional regulator [Comamonadaceae bacterium]
MSDLPLSPRQITCLAWAAAGKTSWETACILRITERTVNFHLQLAYRRLGVHNRAAAVACAIRQGLVDMSLVTEP